MPPSDQTPRVLPGKKVRGQAAAVRTDMTESTFRGTEINFFKAFQTAPTILIISSLADGRFKEVNETFERAMGYRRDEVIGRTSLELNVWQNPQDREVVIQHLAKGKQVRNHEFNFRSKSGEIIIGLYSAEIIDIGAEPCLLSLVNDISARKNAEEELRRSEERYRRLYNDTPVMLHSIDKDGRLISVSNFWLETLGYERDEVIGRRSTDFLTPASRSYATDVVLPEFFRTGTCKDVPYHYVKKNGETVEVLLSAIAERDREGNIIRSLAVMVDVTDRKRLDEEIYRLSTDLAARAYELELANRELEAFNYTVAHDLRKPLSVVNGYSQIIRELCSSNLDAECREYLREIFEGTCRMSRLIDTLLDFSRLAHAKLSRETVDLSAMAHEVCLELQFTASQRRVTFRVADGVTVDGDRNLLRVVLSNLLGNAWKYTESRQEAVIEFGLVEIAGKQTCFVRDNGPGFDMASAETIFTPFKRLATSEKSEGFGIGLATVERIIRRHGGKVWAEGEPGKGAAFYFSL
jgi:PAS domain S-box-containing protein